MVTDLRSLQAPHPWSSSYLPLSLDPIALANLLSREIGCAIERLGGGSLIYPLKRTKSVVNRVLRSVGLEMARHGAGDHLRGKVRQLVIDAVSFSQDTNLPSLPPQEAVGIELLTELCGTSLGEALYILNALHETKDVDGDCCEFGVAQGATSALIAHAIRDAERELWLYDSFEGLPKPTKEDVLKDDIFGLGSIDSYKGTMCSPVRGVRARLDAIGFSQLRTRIIPGFITDRIDSDLLPKKVSFAFVDFDFYEPIKNVLESLDSVAASNAQILVDDYDFFSTGAKTAVDEFVAAHDQYSISFPIPAAGHFALLKRS